MSQRRGAQPTEQPEKTEEELEATPPTDPVPETPLIATPQDATSSETSPTPTA